MGRKFKRALWEIVFCFRVPKTTTRDTSNRTENPIGFNFNLHLSSILTKVVKERMVEKELKEVVGWVKAYHNILMEF